MGAFPTTFDKEALLSCARGELFGESSNAGDDVAIGRAEGEAFGLADDVAEAWGDSAKHVGEAGWLFEAFEGDEGGVGAALAEVNAEEVGGVDGGDVGDGDSHGVSLFVFVGARVTGENGDSQRACRR